MTKKDLSVVEVAIPIGINSFFKYIVPEGMSSDEILYKRVLVNFHGRIIQGYAVSTGSYTDEYKLKKIEKILDKRKIFSKEMVEFAQWVADYYFCGIGEVLSLMVPQGKKIKDEYDGNNLSLSKRDVVLTEKQKKIYEGIIRDIKEGNNRFYLYGVTGSGKTEIYIKLIEDVLNKGKDVIFLVPEIALTYQIFERLKREFGDICAILHSGLTSSSRLKEYLKIFDGKARIAIGPRSAIFAPVKNLGLIIIDEENESSYKSNENPRFHARTLALYLAMKHQAAIILGSATPSIESWYYARNGYLKPYILDERYGGASLPIVEVVDNSKTTLVKNFSINLIEKINSTVRNNNQVIILQNRRGFANFIKCKECNYIFACFKCNVSLTYHKSKNKLICHHCGFTIEYKKNCEKCNSDKLVKIGAGTERIEDEVKEIFGYARVERIDLDSFKKIKDVKAFFKRIEDKEIDILVGTQMIAKGLHFPGIKLVGIINADLILNLPDYKASERAFSLITQVAGRAGREGEKGYVIIQTFNPEHYTIVCARNNDFFSFYEKEIVYRKIMKMPPFTRLARLVVRGKDENRVKSDIEKIGTILREKNNFNITILGPAPCILNKLNNNYRYQILLKCTSITKIQNLLKLTKENFKISSKNFLEIDIDPIDLL